MILLGSLSEHDRDTLVNIISALIPTLQQDPTPVTTLLGILIRPDSFSFDKVLNIKPPVDFAAGLTINSPPINLATLGLLEKATSSASNAGIIAGKPEVVAALVRKWLCTHDTNVAQKATVVLTKLLCVDAGIPFRDEERPSFPADEYFTRLMWRRLFCDKDIYGLVFSLCSLTTAGREGQPSKRDKTVAQSRLLDFVNAFANFPMIHTNQIPEIEEAFGVRSGGLLEFATMHMIDYKNDVLMHVTLIDFFTSFISGDGAREPSSGPDSTFQYSTKRLNFLVSNALHSRTLTYFIYPEEQEPLDVAYLYSRAAHYVAEYVAHYPNHLLKQRDEVRAILTRLSNVLQNVSTGQWAHGKAPKDDLYVLGSMPRITLISGNGPGDPYFQVPSRPISVDGLEAIVQGFGDAKQDTALDLADPTPFIENEKAAGMVLYSQYLEEHQNFWTQVINAAETLALRDNCLAAHAVIKTAIEAEWAPLPSEPSNAEYPLPTDRQLSDSCPLYREFHPTSGVMAVMTSPALDVVVPYLLRPVPPFSSLDKESTAYRISVVKRDILRILRVKLTAVVANANDEETQREWIDVLNTINAVANQVPSQDPNAGGMVATMER